MQIKLLYLKMLEAVIMIEIAMESGIILWPIVSVLLLDQVLHHVLVDYLATQDWVSAKAEEGRLQAIDYLVSHVWIEAMAEEGRLHAIDYLVSQDWIEAMDEVSYRQYLVSHVWIEAIAVESRLMHLIT